MQKNVNPADPVRIYGPIPAPPLPGDVNGDGWVAGRDLITILTYWGQSGLGRAFGDLNANGTVDGPDYSEVVTNWGLKVDEIIWGDLDMDADVDIVDFGIFARDFGQADTVSDINDNGTVDILDFGIFADQFGEGSSSPQTVTPEPTTLMVLGIGGLLMTQRHRISAR